MPETSGKPFGRAPDPQWMNALGKAQGLSSYTPTLSEKFSNYLNSTFYGDSREGQDRANKVVNWVENMVPPVAAADMVYSSGREGAKGNYVGAGLNLAMLGLPAFRKVGMDGWHVSPHNFDKVKWNAEVRGTGEGAQAYGDGFYAAQSPKVSGVGGHYWDQFFHKLPAGPEKTAAFWLKQPGVNFDRNAAADLGQRMFDQNRMAPGNFVDDPMEVANRYETAINMLRGKDPIPPHTYQLHIDASPDNFIQWDKEMVDQPLAVRKLAKAQGFELENPTTEKQFLAYIRDTMDILRQQNTKAGIKMDTKQFDAVMKDPVTHYNVRDADEGNGWGPEYGSAQHALDSAWMGALIKHDMRRNPFDSTTNKWIGDNRIGSDFYHHLKLDLGRDGIPATASGKYGIHGTMFEDGMSRAGRFADKTHNWAIWNPEIVTIMKKLGIAMPAMGAAGYAATQQERDTQ